VAGKVGRNGKQLQQHDRSICPLTSHANIAAQQDRGQKDTQTNIRFLLRFVRV